MQDKNCMTSYTSAMPESWALKLSDDSRQTSVGREFHIRIAHGKKVCPYMLKLNGGLLNLLQ